MEGQPGTYIIEGLPLLNTKGKLTETVAPPNFEKIEPMEVTTGNPDPIELKIVDSSDGDYTSLKILKNDSSDNKLDNCEFKITYTDPKSGEQKTLTGTTGKDGNEPGTLLFEGLPLGVNVTIEETKAADSHELMNPNLVTKKLNDDSTVLEVEFEDPQKAGLKIVKKDDKGGFLNGCKFQVEYTDPTTGAAEVKPGVTGANGEEGVIVFTDLPIGVNLTIRETEALDGYKMMNPNPATTTLVPGELMVLNFVDDMIIQTVNLKIIKSGDDGAKLANAEFSIIRM